AETGNLALKMMATAGVYVGGGIAPKIAERLAGPAFVEAFVSKGRLRPLLEQLPVRLIVNGLVALVGAARWPPYHRALRRRGGASQRRLGAARLNNSSRGRGAPFTLLLLRLIHSWALM